MIQVPGEKEGKMTKPKGTEISWPKITEEKRKRKTKKKKKNTFTRRRRAWRSVDSDGSSLPVRGGA